MLKKRNGRRHKRIRFNCIARAEIARREICRKTCLNFESKDGAMPGSPVTISRTRKSPVTPEVGASSSNFVPPHLRCTRCRLYAEIHFPGDYARLHKPDFFYSDNASDNLLVISGKRETIEPCVSEIKHRAWSRDHRARLRLGFTADVTYFYERCTAT